MRALQHRRPSSLRVGTKVCGKGPRAASQQELSGPEKGRWAWVGRKGASHPPQALEHLSLACPCAQEALNPARASPSRIRRPVHPGARPRAPPRRRYKARVLLFLNPPPPSPPWPGPRCWWPPLWRCAYCWRPPASRGTSRRRGRDTTPWAAPRGCCPASTGRRTHGALSPAGARDPWEKPALSGRCTPTCGIS